MTHHTDGTYKSFEQEIATRWLCSEKTNLVAAFVAR